MLIDVLTAAVLVAVGVRLVGAARISMRQRARVERIVRGVRWRHVWPAPLVLVAVGVVASLLLLVPGLDLGWWTLIGGAGNPVLGSTDQTSGTVLSWLVPALFITLLLPALPLFAEAEERMFRLGAEQWSAKRRLGKAVQFGLVHAIIGIPIGVALALSLGGLYFTHCYLRAWRHSASQGVALLESTRAHFSYNAFVFVSVGVAIVVVALVG